MSVDLTTTYLGLELRSPLIASASPLTRRLDALRAIDAAGAGAVVLPSLFEEQILAEASDVDDLLGSGDEFFAEAQSFFPSYTVRATSTEDHLAMVRAAVATVSVPVIASLNGSSAGGWTYYAAQLAEAGAHALELNVYRVAADPDKTGAQVEQDVVDLVAAVRAEVSIPLAVKLSPFFTSLGNVARRVVAAGADGLVLFNRFYQPDLDLESLEATPRLVLSSPDELRLPLRWIGLLHGRVEASLALTTGVHSGLDAVKAILVGADAVMTTSALLHHGAGRLATIQRDLADWFDGHEYDSVAQAKGSAAWVTGPDPAGFERANYHEVLAAGDRW